MFLFSVEGGYRYLCTGVPTKPEDIWQEKLFKHKTNDSVHREKRGVYTHCTNLSKCYFKPNHKSLDLKNVYFYLNSTLLSSNNIGKCEKKLQAYNPIWKSMV